MKMTFRWYGSDDPVTLDNIRQIPGMTGVVTAVYSVPAGEVWPTEEIDRMKKEVNDKGLEMEVIESVPVHEDIKLGRGDYKRYIENYKENIRRLAKAGVKCICYNFMPVFDWTRSRLDQPLPDGSNALVYYKEDVDKMDPTKLALPGWDASYSTSEMSELIDAYKTLGEEGLWKNLDHFINEILPVAAECDVNMAIHPDDPPWDIFGLPRLIVDAESVDRFLSMVDDPYNCLSLCSGSLNANPNNNVAEIVRKHCDRIPFAHIRNIHHFENGDFSEAAHRDCCGETGIIEILRAYHDCGFDGCIRPDHGRQLWEEGPGNCRPGYGKYDRALGIQYMLGVWDLLDRLDEEKKG